MKSGEKQTAVMTCAEVDAIRNKSRAGKSGPWVDHWGEMAKKTAVRRLSKMLPLSSEIMSHVERDDDQFAGMRNANPRKNPFAALPMAEDAPQADAPEPDHEEAQP